MKAKPLVALLGWPSWTESLGVKIRKYLGFLHQSLLLAFNPFSFLLLLLPSQGLVLNFLGVAVASHASFYYYTFLKFNIIIITPDYNTRVAMSFSHDSFCSILYLLIRAYTIKPPRAS